MRHSIIAIDTNDYKALNVLSERGYEIVHLISRSDLQKFVQYDCPIAVRVNLFGALRNTEATLDILDAMLIDGHGEYLWFDSKHQSQLTNDQRWQIEQRRAPIRRVKSLGELFWMPLEPVSDSALDRNGLGSYHASVLLLDVSPLISPVPFLNHINWYKIWECVNPSCMRVTFALPEWASVVDERNRSYASTEVIADLLHRWRWMGRPRNIVPIGQMAFRIAFQAFAGKERVGGNREITIVEGLTSAIDAGILKPLNQPVRDPLEVSHAQDT